MWQGLPALSKVWHVTTLKHMREAQTRPSLCVQLCGNLDQNLPL